MEKEKELNSESAKKSSGLFNTFKRSSDNIKSTVTIQKNSVKKKWQQKKEDRENKKRLKELSPMAKAAPGNITGPIFLVVGLIILGIVLGFGGAFYFIYHRSLVFICLVFIVPLIISLGLLYLGITQNIHAETYATYRSVFKKKPYVSIHELSEKTHQTEFKTVKNLKAFQNEGLYPKGYFIHNDKYFVLSKGAEELLDEALKVESKSKIKESDEKNLEENYPKLYQIYNQIKEVRDNVKDLKKKESALRKPQLEDDLMEMDYNLKQIQTYILKKPEEVPDLRNFLDYFLPTVTKLLNTYCELDKVKIRTDNVIESQNEIEEALKTVNSAFKNMYNDFYTGTVIDVYADIQVLKTMINKHGFAESDF